MRTFAASVGYVVEADKKGYFYNRLGQWAEYGSPAEGYVWSDEEVAAIKDACAKGTTKWELTPAKLHPAIYDDRSGVTVITDKSQSINSVQLHSLQNVHVPSAGGTIFDHSKVATRLGGNNFMAAAKSL